MKESIAYSMCTMLLKETKQQITLLFGQLTGVTLWSGQGLQQQIVKLLYPVDYIYDGLDKVIVLVQE